jgi:hypothetical protein
MRKSSATTRQATDGDDREQFHAAAEIVLAAGGACLATAITAQTQARDTEGTP